MKLEDTPRGKTVRLSDYQAPDFRISQVALRFELGDPVTRVHSKLQVQRNGSHDRPLRLDGEQLELVSLTVDGAAVSADRYAQDAAGLTVSRLGAEFELEIETAIRPQDNTALSGLYLSGGNYCTQCEAEGFRRITYFMDRPDVLTRYSTTIIADKQQFPVLLSNGNLAAHRDLEDGRHEVTWDDPFPKPSYLFALVAGDLTELRDSFQTCSGRHVDLYIYVQEHNATQCGHAMASLQNAMRWDEQAYGREYDLDRYMIVVVDDFNMGAMENKGLNIFNSKYVLADPETATDADYEHVEAVVGHEYFHNWSGNRVTCRDWFQLSLKEGFTVFREQQFSAAMGSAAVKRIQDVNVLRTHQFREDAGPMAHPVRPDAYQEIDNFYTVTVYNKGAEVIRMLHRLLGASGFRRGTDHYFAKHDGAAVTTDDFVRCMQEANAEDLGQFRRWYDQAGTPVVSVSESYDETAQSYSLTLRQSCPDTPGQRDKLPFHIPIAVGLFDPAGRPMPVSTATQQGRGHTAVLELREREQVFEFEGVPTRPTVSLLREFSAPVRIEMDRPDAELYLLMRHDDDPFGRWEAAQQLAIKQLLALVEQTRQGATLEVDADLIAAYRRNLTEPGEDLSFAATMLTLPDQNYLSEFVDPVDPDAVYTAHTTLRRSLAQELKADLMRAYRAHHDPDAEYPASAQDIGRRRLKNLCLDYLLELNHDDVRGCALTQLETARNMTDAVAALRGLANTDCDERHLALQSFYARWREETLVVDKWLSVQATSRLEDALDQVRSLTRHPAFNRNTPNKVYALLNAFASANPVRFHGRDGAGYQFIADWVLELDPVNPQVAARLAGAFNLWRRFEPGRRDLMRGQLERIAAVDPLSPAVAEIVEKGLSD